MKFIVPLVFILFIVGFILAMMGIKATNKFKALDIKVNESLSDIDVALQKRHSVLAKSFDVASQYARFERDMILRVIAIRQHKTIEDLEKANTAMDGATKHLFALAENYPQLRSSDQFVQLQKAIADTEEHLQAARRAYNANVREYNKAIVVFPNCLFASSYSAKNFFVANDTSDVGFNRPIG